MPRTLGYPLSIQANESLDMILWEGRDVSVEVKMRLIQEGEYFLRRYVKGEQDIYFMHGGKAYIETEYRAKVNTSRRKARIV
jgi:hypothetical protein